MLWITMEILFFYLSLIGDIVVDVISVVIISVINVILLDVTLNRCETSFDRNEISPKKDFFNRKLKFVKQVYGNNL